MCHYVSYVTYDNICMYYYMKCLPSVTFRLNNGMTNVVRRLVESLAKWLWSDTIETLVTDLQLKQ